MGGKFLGLQITREGDSSRLGTEANYSHCFWGHQRVETRLKKDRYVHSINRQNWQRLGGGRGRQLCHMVTLLIHRLILPGGRNLFMLTARLSH